MDARDTPAILGFGATSEPHRDFRCGIDLRGPPSGLDAVACERRAAASVVALAGPVLSAFTFFSTTGSPLNVGFGAILAPHRGYSCGIDLPGPL